MKKIYLCAFASLVAVAANAQTTLRIKNPMKKAKTANERSGSPNSVQQVAATITCNTQYVAGSTMDLAMTYQSTNTDQEYVDYLAITFPAGITPTGAANTSNPFPNTEDPGGGLEAMNAPAGQMISWGVDNNDQYGGIVSTAGISFTVNVTVTAGLTGNQAATFTASGDGFGASPGNATGTFTVYPVGAATPDLKTTLVQPLNLTALNVCNYGSDTVVAVVKNIGNTTESNISVMYSVNGAAQPATTYTGSLAPGDSTIVGWLPAFDFSASNIYSIKAWTALAGDINTSNDTAMLSFSNSVSTPLTSTSYSNGIESAYDFGSLNRAFVSGDGYIFGPSTATFHTGAQALFYTVPNAATAGVHEAMVILPCMDVVSGEIYRISFWKRINGSAANANGQSGVFTGTANDATAMTTILKPYAPIATYATWIKDSVDYTATATETRYFALGGKGAVVAGTNQINVRYDDINITKVTTTGIKSNEISNGVYPNPTNGVLNISITAANASVEFYNAMGQNVMSKSLNNGANAVDMSGLSNGVYSVRIIQNGAATITKVIKTN